MLFTEDQSDAPCQITAYDAQSITINGQKIHSSVILFPSQFMTDWAPQSLPEITTQNLQPILAQAPEILLIGTGSKPQRLAPSLREFLEQHNIGVECMTTPAACRSYMALLSEGRNIAAIIFLGS